MLTRRDPVRPPFAPPSLPASTGHPRTGPDRHGAIAALGHGLAFGTLLGCWCGMFAHSESVNGVLANLASPWVAAAFASGAVAARPRAAMGHRRQGFAASAVAGALAGMVCLVAATVVYYGPARTGRFDFDGAASRTAFWSGAGIAAGLVFGGAGAAWRGAASDRVRAACPVLFGAVVAGEAGVLILAGATRDDAYSLPVVVAVGAVGLVIPFLLGPSRRSAQRVGLVAVLTVPVMLSGLAVVAVATAVARAVRVPL